MAYGVLYLAADALSCVIGSALVIAGRATAQSEENRAATMALH